MSDDESPAMGDLHAGHGHFAIVMPAQSRRRRLGGIGFALAASAVIWIAAQVIRYFYDFRESAVFLGSLLVGMLVTIVILEFHTIRLLRDRKREQVESDRLFRERLTEMFGASEEDLAAHLTAFDQAAEPADGRGTGPAEPGGEDVQGRPDGA